MGQRTQMLVTVSFDGKVKTSISLHYQWGYGRTMLIDALRTITFLSYNGFYDKRLSKREFTERIVSQSIGHLNFGDNMDEYIDEVKNWVKEPFNETLEEVMECSDNNDGYIHLKVIYESFESIGQIKFYNRDSEEISFEQYCRQSDDNYYTTKEFRNAFRGLLKEFGVEI